MKRFTGFFRNLLWITQLGFSVVVPLVLFTLLGVWLNRRFALGGWCVIVGVVVGLLGAIGGLYQSLRIMNRLEDDDEKRDPPRGYNDHD